MFIIIPRVCVRKGASYKCSVAKYTEEWIINVATKLTNCNNNKKKFFLMSLCFVLCITNKIRTKVVVCGKWLTKVHFDASRATLLNYAQPCKVETWYEVRPSNHDIFGFKIIDLVFLFRFSLSKVFTNLRTKITTSGYDSMAKCTVLW